jgi:protein-glutamine gamma-glutamyltransferase
MSSSAIAIGNRVWFDADEDGLQDLGDPDEFGVSGIEVKLHRYDGGPLVLLGTTLTNSEGLYQFTELSSDWSYMLEVECPKAFWFTYHQGGTGSADPTLDSDVIGWPGPYNEPPTGFTRIILGDEPGTGANIDIGYVLRYDHADPLEEPMTYTPPEEGGPGEEGAGGEEGGENNPANGGLFVGQTRITTDSQVYQDFKDDPVAKEWLDQSIPFTKRLEYTSEQRLRDYIKLAQEMVKAAEKVNELGIGFNGRVRAEFTESDNFEVRGAAGIQVKNGKKPSDGIDEIFAKPKKATFDCSSATMLIAHKAMKEVYGAAQYDTKIKRLEIDGFEVDPDLRARYGHDKVPIRPGDRVLFYNPDAAQQAWERENTIYLGGGKYFAHGLVDPKNRNGAKIYTEAKLIELLNGLRRDNATQSAYKDDSSGWTLFPKDNR